MSDSAPRPRQLTMAGGFVIVGSLLLLFSVFDTLAALNSVDMRNEVEQVLSSPSGEGLGLSVAQALTLMRVGLQVAAVCAAVAMVLGIFAMQRHRGARLGLGVVAVPILLTAPLTGGLLGALVAAAVATLWSGPARDWYAGRPVREAKPLFRRTEDEPKASSRPDPFAAPRPSGPEGSGAAESERPRQPEVPTVYAPGATGETPTQPPPTQGFGQGPVQPQSQGQSQGQSQRQSQTQYPAGPPSAYGAAPTYAPQHAAAPGAQVGAGWPPGAYAVAGPAPTPVRVACALTWVFSGMVALVYLAMLVALLVAQDQIVDLIRESPAFEQAQFDTDLLLPALWVGSLSFLGWTVAAMVLAFLTWRRHNWARYLLVGSSAMTFLIGFLTFPVGLVHQLAALAVAVLLMRPSVRDWFAMPRHGTPPPPAFGGPQQPMQQPGQQPGQPPGQQSGQPPVYPHDPAQGDAQHPPEDGKPPVW